jgi:hypothetical protein
VSTVPKGVMSLMALSDSVRYERLEKDVIGVTFVIGPLRDRRCTC